MTVSGMALPMVSSLACSPVIRWQERRANAAGSPSRTPVERPRSIISHNRAHRLRRKWLL